MQHHGDADGAVRFDVVLVHAGSNDAMRGLSMRNARRHCANRLSHGVATHRGIHFVDDFREEPRDPYSKRPGHFGAIDGFHPSGAAYRLCQERVRRKVPMDAWLRRSRNSYVRL